MVDILRINYASGDLNFIREIKLNEIAEKIIRDLLRVDPSHRANSFIIRNGPTLSRLTSSRVSICGPEQVIVPPKVHS